MSLLTELCLELLDFPNGTIMIASWMFCIFGFFFVLSSNSIPLWLFWFASLSAFITEGLDAYAPIKEGKAS